jgi:hypothetical protein
LSLNKIIVPTTTAAGAIAAAMMSSAAVAQSADTTLALSFEGVVGSGNQANAYGSAKLGDGFDAFEDDVAFVGSVGLSRAINEDWDWSLSVSQLGYAENLVSDQDDLQDAIVTSRSSASRSEMDFSFGRNVSVGSANARLGLGLAYAKASAEKGLDATDFENGDYFRNDLRTEFQGIGPRLSVDVQSAPIGANGKLSVIGGVEVNLLAGKYKHSKGLEAYNEGETPPSFSGEFPVSDNGDMMTGGIKLGMEYTANDNTSFRAGVRYDVSRMDRATMTGPTSVSHVSVVDDRTSFFVGMNVGF